MALINCPDCHKPVSDQAHACPYCGLPVAAYLERVKQEKEERRAEEEALRQRQAERRTTTQFVMGVIAVFLIVMMVSCISNASQHPVLRNMEATGSQKPGDTVFSARGKLSLQYSCESGTEKATTVQFSLVNMRPSRLAAIVWKKMITCTTPNQDITTHTETIQVSSGLYDVGVVVSTGDTNWNMVITQA